MFVCFFFWLVASFFSVDITFNRFGKYFEKLVVMYMMKVPLLMLWLKDYNIFNILSKFFDARFTGYLGWFMFVFMSLPACLVCRATLHCLGRSRFATDCPCIEIFPHIKILHEGFCFRVCFCWLCCLFVCLFSLGGIPAFSKGERVILFIGIIDILQSYRWVHLESFSRTWPTREAFWLWSFSESEHKRTFSVPGY